MANPTFIYRILHWKNLEGILLDGGIYAPNRTPQTARAYVSIHHVSIQSQRASTPVPIAPGGGVHDYVPFYFTPLSPMLFRNHRQTTGDNDQGQELIVILAAEAETVDQAGLAYVFTDGHSIMKLSNFYNDLRHLDQLPWEVIEAQYWPNFDDGSRLRQAEFLVHEFVPWPLIKHVATVSEAMRAKVQAVLDDHLDKGPHPTVRVVPSWYF